MPKPADKVQGPDLTDLDMVPRYAPVNVIIASRMKQFPVTRYIAHPPTAHPPGCPIAAGWTVLECQTAAGSRWYGCVRAYITSDLRMAVVGTPRRDEVRMRWPVVKGE